MLDPRGRGPAINNLTKLVLLLATALACSAQTLNLTSADSRCSPRGPQSIVLALIGGLRQDPNVALTCTFTNRETLPMDYGIPILAYGTGVWTLGAQTPATCSYRLFNVNDSTGAAVTTITPPATFYIQPLYRDVENCPAGTYTHVLPFTNGGQTVKMNAVQIINFRRAAPVYFNGYGVADSALGSFGWSQGAVGAASFSYDLNQQACANCNPGQNPVNLPPSPGSSFTDELGNTITVITPPGSAENAYSYFSHQNSEKAAMNLNDTYVMVSNQFGNYNIWDTNGNQLWPTLNTNFDFGDQGAYCWSSTSANDVYSIITDSNVSGFAFSGVKASNPGIFKKITLGAAPAYTVQTGSAESTGQWWVFPASLGYVLANTISHGDCDNANRMPVATIKQYATTVNVSGATVTATGGDAFDNHLLDQPVLGQTVTAVNSPTQLTLSAAPGDQTGTALFLTAMQNMCVVDLEAAGAGGPSYTPVCADVSTMPRPLINYTANPGMFLSNGVDAVSGMSYAYLGNQPYAVVGRYRPGIDTSLTITRSFLAQGDSYSDICDDGAANNTPAGNTLYRCLGGEHGDVFHTADGSQWLAVNHDGTSWSTFRFRDLANTPPTKVYEAGGYYSVTQFTNYVAGEAGGARLAPYWIISGDNDVLLPGATSQAVNTCTNTNPAVLQLAQTPDYTSGAAILVNGVQGNTACNGVHTAVAISGNNVTLEVNGNGVPVVDTGAVTQNVTFAGNNQPDADQAAMFRHLGIEAHRIGHLRSVLYPNDHIAASYWAQPRMSPCMDGTCAIFTTNFGLPENYQVAMVKFPNSGGALQANQFDATHAVTPAVTAHSVTFNYSTPDSGPAIVEIGLSRRLTDGTVAADPSGSCPTVLQAVLSLASTSVFTCNASQSWASSTPDSSYQVTIDSSQSNSRSDTFSGLEAGNAYYYRITANNKTLAYGTIVPQ
jgi:hypothetical protein